LFIKTQLDRIGIASAIAPHAIREEIERKRKNIKYYRWLYVICIFIYVVVLIFAFHCESQTCKEKSKNIAVLIARFKVTSPDHMYSSLINYISDDFADIKSKEKIEIDTTQYLNNIESDQLKKLFGCYGKGILIYGNKDNTIIRPFNLWQKEKTRLTIRYKINEPDSINFIVTRATYVSKFAVALIYYSNKNFNKSILILEQLVNSEDNLSSGLKAFACLFEAYNYINLEKDSIAIQYLKKAKSYDPIPELKELLENIEATNTLYKSEDAAGISKIILTGTNSFEITSTNYAPHLKLFKNGSEINLAQSQTSISIGQVGFQTTYWENVQTSEPLQNGRYTFKFYAEKHMGFRKTDAGKRKWFEEYINLTDSIQISIKNSFHNN
jgi:hypothetical protein